MRNLIQEEEVNAQTSDTHNQGSASSRDPQKNEDEVLTHSEKQSSFGVFFKNLHWLFLNPSRFFGLLPLLKQPLFVFVCLWLFGMSNVIDGLDRKLIKIELGTATDRELHVVETLFSNWSTLFISITGIGIVSAFFIWLVGGWFYNLRISWSGAKDLNKADGRLVYVLSNLVAVLPHLLLVLFAATQYSDYLTWYFYEDDDWSLLLVPFLFWSIFTSYKAVSTRFEVVRWKAMIWFALLPTLFYLFTIGLITYLFINLP